MKIGLLRAQSNGSMMLVVCFDRHGHQTTKTTPLVFYLIPPSAFLSPRLATLLHFPSFASFVWPAPDPLILKPILTFYTNSLQWARTGSSANSSLEGVWPSMSFFTASISFGSGMAGIVRYIPSSSPASQLTSLQQTNARLAGLNTLMWSVSTASRITRPRQHLMRTSLALPPPPLSSTSKTVRSTCSR